MGRLFPLVLFCVVLAGAAPPALGHAVLLDTAPGADARLDAAPERIELLFNEPVEPVRLRILDAEGTEVGGQTRALGERVAVALPEELPDGSYIVSWRVISADSHPVGGSFRFAVGAESDGAPAPPELDAGSEAGWRAAALANRAVFLFALLGSVGGVWFLALFRPSPGLAEQIAPTILGLGGLAVLTALLTVPAQGGLMLGASLREAAGAVIWRAGFDSSLGQAATVAAAALVLMLVGAALRAPLALAVASGAGAVALGTLLTTGHVATAEPRWATVPAHGVHLVAAAYWLGALMPLLAALSRHPPAEAAMLLGRFSRVAMAIVALLITAGLVLAAVQVAQPGALAAQAYGQLLVGKVILVAALLGLAAFNKWRLMPDILTGSVRARQRLDRSIRVEIVLVALILAVTAALGQATPPRTGVHDGHAHHGHETDPDPADLAPRTGMMTSGDYRAAFEIGPGRVGDNDLSVMVLDADGMPIEALGAELRLVHPEAGIEPLEAALAEGDTAGWFETSQAHFPLAGRWTVEIVVLVSDFERVRFGTELEIE